ncbi:MAG: hypothetical protein ACI805_002693, partial [Candidatus Azotimanducaceae bacterium]
RCCLVSATYIGLRRKSTVLGCNSRYYCRKGIAISEVRLHVRKSKFSLFSSFSIYDEEKIRLRDGNLTSLAGDALLSDHISLRMVISAKQRASIQKVLKFKTAARRAATLFKNLDGGK